TRRRIGATVARQPARDLTAPAGSEKGAPRRRHAGRQPPALRSRSGGHRQTPRVLRSLLDPGAPRVQDDAGANSGEGGAMTSVADIPAVRKTITINASVEDAFRGSTEGQEPWWPRTHPTGKVPMQKGIIETREGGRCYSIQTDGSECDWGRVLVWD